MLGGGGPAPQPTSDKERAAVEALASFRATGFGYFVEQATRPQTIGYALLDSPIALAGWMLDHDTDSYLKRYENRSRARLARSPARSSAGSRRATSPGITSSTTSRCTG